MNLPRELLSGMMPSALRAPQSPLAGDVPSDKYLFDLSRALMPAAAPAHDLKHRENYIYDLIANYIERNCRYAVTRMRRVSSSDRRTASWLRPELQLLVYVHEPAFEPTALLHDLRRCVLSEMHCLQQHEIHVDSVGMSVGFTVEELEVRLLPAPSFVPPSQTFTPHNQTRAVLEHMHALNQPAAGGMAMHTACRALREMHVDFIREQSKFAQDFMRLALFWNSQLYIYAEHVPASKRERIIELVALNSAQDEEATNRTNLSLIRTLGHFWDSLVNLSSQYIILPNHVYSCREISDSMYNTRPLLLDPVNPYNNLLSGCGGGDSRFFRKVKLFAAESKKRFMHGHGIAKSFSPQPETTECMFRELGVSTCSIIISSVWLELRTEDQPSFIVKGVLGDKVMDLLYYVRTVLSGIVLLEVQNVKRGRVAHHDASRTDVADVILNEVRATVFAYNNVKDMHTSTATGSLHPLAVVSVPIDQSQQVSFNIDLQNGLSTGWLSSAATGAASAATGLLARLKEHVQSSPLLPRGTHLELGSEAAGSSFMPSCNNIHK